MFAAFLRFLQDAPREIILVPARHDEDDAPAGGKSREQCCAVLVPDAIAHRLRLRFFTVLHHIVDEEEIGTLAGDASAETDGDHAARVPFNVPIRLRAVRAVETDAEKGFSEVRDLLAVAVAELLREVRAVAHLDHAPIGIPTKEP